MAKEHRRDLAARDRKKPAAHAGGKWLNSRAASVSAKKLPFIGTPNTNIARPLIRKFAVPAATYGAVAQQEFPRGRHVTV